MDVGVEVRVVATCSPLVGEVDVVEVATTGGSTTVCVITITEVVPMVVNAVTMEFSAIKAPRISINKYD